MFNNTFKIFIRSCSFILVTYLLLSPVSLLGQSKIWVGTWSCAPYAVGSGNTPPSPYLANNTLRQVVRVSIGGDTLRLKFSNKTGASPVTMNSVNVAVSKGSSTIDAATIKQLKFNNGSSVTIPTGGSATSDPVAFALTPGMRVAITIYYGQAASTTNMTGHVGSRTDSYILAGDQTSSADFQGAVITPHWYTINTIDVLAPATAGCVAILGNSITDGYGLSGGLQNRWTDFFSQALINNPATLGVGVLNLGIGGTNVTGTGATTGASRYQQDILSQSGLRWVIIFYGTNDIAGGATASTIISAYQKMINDAHTRNMKVYGATITPFYGSGHYSEANEVVRNTVNNWIRTPGNFDAIIDFDKTIRDTNDPRRLLTAYSKDGLHPNVAGYQLLGESVNLNLFTEITNNQLPIANAGADQSFIDFDNKGSRSVTLNGSGSYGFGGTINSYVWSKDGKEITTGEKATINLPLGTHILTLTVTDTNGHTDTDEVIVKVIKDSGVWMNAECATVGSRWNIEADDNASNDKYVTIQPGNNSSNAAPTNASDHLSFTFNLNESGIYTLWARVMCPDPNGDSFWLKMDNGAFGMWNNIANSSFWLWDRYASTYNLTAGIHTLTIAYREDGAKLDQIWITNNSVDLTGGGSPDNNCVATGMPTLNLEEINSFPNPITETLNLTLSSTPSLISVYNINGQQVLSLEAKTADVRLNMANCSPGIYFIKIADKEHTVRKKIIKINP